MMHSNSVKLAEKIRASVLDMVHSAKSSHIGSCYSAADIIAVLYSTILRYKPEDPQWHARDRFILSKGHAAAAVYSVLAAQGFFPGEWLKTYGQNGTPLQGHLSHHVPGVEISTGALGHGLSIGSGMALAAKHDSREYNVYVVLSDGECDEGSVWEAALFAAHHKLNNLTAIIDYNKIQGFGRTCEVLDLEPFIDKWRAFCWEATECDGHDHDALKKLLSRRSEQPQVIVAHTVKGKGVSFMEDQLMWHYRSPDEAAYQEALKELAEVAL